MVFRAVAGAFLHAVYRLQSNAEVRLAESAVVFLALGGFYAIAIMGLLDPNGLGPIRTVIDSLSIPLTVGLTVGVPILFILLEWLAAADELRRQPGYGGWNLDQRAYVLFEIGNEIRDRATVVYVPLAPIAAFWTITLLVRGSPLAAFAAGALLLDLGLLFAINRFMRLRDPARLPPGTTLGA